MRTAGLVVVLIIAAGCVLVLGATLRTRGLDTAADVAQLISLAGLLPLLAALVGSWRKARRPGVVTPADLTAARDQLALLVGERWRAEAEVRELHDPDPIPVRWRITRQPAPGAVVTIASSADVPALIDVYRRLRRRRLVILGNAGAGKTTLAVQILLRLLDERTDRSAAPVPVLFSLADWRPGTDLRRWLTSRIVTDYPGLADAGHDRATIGKLVTDAHVLPVLDGLDEAPDDARAHFVQAADRALGDRIELVLTSRTDEFNTAVSDGRGLSAALVIEPEPLTGETAADYLESCLPRRPHPAWKLVLRRLRSPDGEAADLSEVVSTPLGLWLVRATYITPAINPAGLLDRFKTASGLRSHLFGELVGASIRARPPSGDPAEIFRPRRQYDPDQATSSLRFLARNLSSWDERRDLDWTTDFARLFEPPRWPARAAGLLERVMPPVQLAILRGASLGARQLAGAGALLLAAFTLLCMTGWIGALAVLILVGLGVALFLLVALGTDDSGRIQVHDTDWAQALTDGADGLNAAANAVVARVSFAGVCGLIAGLPTGLVAHLILRDPHVWWAALGAAIAVAALSATSYTVEPWPALRAPWYGNRPGQGLAKGLWGGLWTGSAAAVLLGQAYGDGTFWVFLALAVPVSCASLGVADALAIPLLCAVSTLAVRPIRRVSVAGDGEPLALWRTDRAAQLARLVRLAVIAGLLTTAVAVGLQVIRQQPWWLAFRAGDLPAWLSAHADAVEIAVPGHWNYLIIAGVALLLAQVLAWWGRRWPIFVGWLVLTGIGITIWPHGWGRDDLALTVRARFVAGQATFTWDGVSRFLGLESTGHAVRTLDLDRLLNGGGVRTAALIWLTTLAMIVVTTLHRRVDSGHSQLWWSAATATRRHVRKGRLPRNPLVFLDDCRRLGLLRTVGPIYQFRHADFQDHLATEE